MIDSDGGADFLQRSAPCLARIVGARDTVMVTHINILDRSLPLYRRFGRVLLPLVGSNTLQLFSTAASLIFVGQLIGGNAVATAAASYSVTFLLYSFIIGISSGAGVLMAQAFGSNSPARITRVAGTIVSLSLAASTMTSVAGVLLVPWMLRVLATPTSIYGATNAYINIQLITVPILFPYFVLLGLVRASGDTRMPLMIQILTMVVSIALVPLFIWGSFGLPAIGVLSIPIASAIGQIMGFIVLSATLARQQHPLRFNLTLLKAMITVDISSLRSIIAISLPIASQVLLASLSTATLLSLINRFGANATAAYGAVNEIATYLSLAAVAIGQSASTFSAQCIGAQQEDQLHLSLRAAIIWNYALLGGMTLITYAFSDVLLRCILTDQSSLVVAKDFLLVSVWSYLVYGHSCALSGTVKGSGSVLIPSVIYTASTWIVQVPAAAFLAMHIGLRGIWLSYPLNYMMAFGGVCCYYQFWKKTSHRQFSHEVILSSELEEAAMMDEQTGRVVS